MTIPALATADKLFICSYSIGANIDHRKALGIINEITTFTSEYIDGFCWIPVVSPQETNDHSWWWDLPDKDQVYVKVGVRVSADGYLHAWLLSTQAVSELIQWNNAYDDTNAATNDTTTLHWCIEKMYRVVFGNTTSFVAANIKFQNYVSGATRLYLFGNNSNSLSNGVAYSGGGGTVVKAGAAWYPNNTSTIISDILYASGAIWTCGIRYSYAIDADGWCEFSYQSADAAYLDDGGSFTDYTTEFNNSDPNDCPLMPATEAIGDAFYMGCDYKFDTITFNIGQAGVGTAITWEYWNGSAWTALSVADTTSGYTVAGVGDVTFTIPGSWAKTTVNGYNAYYVRSRVSTASFTTQPILSNGTLRTSSEIWGKAPEQRDPVFIRVDVDTKVEPIPSLCDPTSSGTDGPHTFCFDYVVPGSGVGNNSSRSYTIYMTYGSNCGVFICSAPVVAFQAYSIDIEPNRAYIWVDPPGVYQCDPLFTYDSSVSFDYGKYTQIYPTETDYLNSRAKFSGVPVGTKIYVDYVHPDAVIDTFDEYGGDLDTLKNNTLSNLDSNTLYSIFTKHVGLGVLTGAVTLALTSDWIVTWSSVNYFSNWQTPDGLAARTPAVTNTPYVHPFTHHDEFSVVSGEPVLGGFLYALATSPGFLSRDPGTETKIPYPVSNLGEFDFLVALLTSSAFLSRDPGTETKILYPVSNLGEFEFLVALITSSGFLSRDPGSDTMIPYPVGHDADFCHLYLFVKPPFSVLYHLKTAGDDLKDGLSWANAWKTWAHAMQNTPNERTLLVMHGTYSGELQANPDNSIVIFLMDLSGNDAPSTATVTLA